MSTFIERILHQSPDWLIGERGLAAGFVGCVWSLTGDLGSHVMTLATMFGRVKYEGMPPDALPLFGWERLMSRYSADTDATYQTRLGEAWDVHRLAGTAAGISGQFEAAGYPGATVETTFDGVSAPNWSTFWVRLPEGSHSVTAAGTPVGSFDVGDGTLVGPDGIDLETLDTWGHIIRTQKPVDWICGGIIAEIPGDEILIRI
jgi:hypothetical protein